MNSWMRGRGRSRVVVEVGPPARAVETDVPQPSPRGLVTQGARSQMPPERDETMQDWMRGRGGDGVWDRLVVDE